MNEIHVVFCLTLYKNFYILFFNFLFSKNYFHNKTNIQTNNKIFLEIHSNFFAKSFNKLIN